MRQRGAFGKRSRTAIAQIANRPGLPGGSFR